MSTFKWFASFGLAVTIVPALPQNRIAPETWLCLVLMGCLSVSQEFLRTDYEFMMGNKSLVFRLAAVEVREREFSLIKAGTVLAVEPKAFRVLLLLLRSPQKLISKEELLNSVWGDTAVYRGFPFPYAVSGSLNTGSGSIEIASYLQFRFPIRVPNNNFRLLLTLNLCGAPAQRGCEMPTFWWRKQLTRIWESAHSSKRRRKDKRLSFKTKAF